MFDSFEFTKYAAAVLSALLVIVGAHTAIEISQSEHGGGHGDKHGFTLPAPKEAPAADAKGGGAAPAAAFDAEKVVGMVGSASADAGRDVFGKCKACHTVDKDGKNGQGPNLWGVVGRARASHAGFSYSDALKSKSGNWNYADLAQFIHNPKGYAPGTKMSFNGLPDPTDLANLLAFLRTQSDSPAPVPGK